MGFQPGAVLNTQSFGNRAENVEVPTIQTRDPSVNDTKYPLGKRWINKTGNTAWDLTSFSSIGGILQATWSSGGNAPATTTSYGLVLLTDNSEPVATKAYADALAIAGAPVATVAVAGIGELATDAEAVAGTASTPTVALFVTPSNLSAVFAAPPSAGFGSTTPRPVAATTLSTTGAATIGTTLGVTGASTLAALSATTGTFSSTLGVTGVTTLAAVGATNGTFSGTLGVTGTTTIGVLSATNGTFSGTLGVTGTMTIGVLAATNATFSGTLGVSGASSFSSGTFSTTLGVTGASTFTSGTFSTTLGVTGLTTLGALTVVGNTLINNSGGGTTTIGGTAAGAIGIVVGSAGNFTLSTSTAGATMAIGSATQTGAITVGASTAGQTINISSAATIAGTNVVNVLAGATPGASQTFNLMTGIGTAGTYAVNVLTGASTGTTQTLSLATGAAATTISIGNITGSTGMTLSVGTNNFSVVGAVTSAYTIGTALGTGLISIGVSTAGQTVAINNAASNTVANVVNILNGATPGANNTLNIMNGAGSAGTQTFNLLASGATRAGAVNIATGVAAHAVTIGQVTTTIAHNGPTTMTLASGSAVGLTVNTSSGTGRGVSVSSSGVAVPDYASLVGGILVTPTDVTAGASPRTANNRHFKVVFSSVSIAANADQTLTITNSVITDANTDIMISWSGTTTGSAVSLKSVVSGAGTVALTFTNGVGATTTTSNITVVGWVMN